MLKTNIVSVLLGIVGAVILIVVITPGALSADTTPTTTPVPVTVIYAPETVTQMPTPEIVMTPAAMPEAEPTTTSQTRPGDSWWLYLGGLLLLGAGGAGAYLLFLKK